MKNLTDYILENIEPVIQKILKEYEKNFLEDFEREMSDYDREIARLTLIYDMLRSIEVYTKPTDTLINATVRNTPKGSLIIDAIIGRDDVYYPFSTEVIYAGGYNIQRLHFRYITKTNIPKTNNSTNTDIFHEKIVKLTKVQKLTKEIESLEKRIIKNNETVEANKKLSDQDILNKNEYWHDIDWDEIVRRGSDVNYNYSKEEFDKKHSQYRQSIIDNFKKIRIQSIEENTNSLKKEIIKLKVKLNSILNL